MGKYYPPDGYIKDDNSGLFYETVDFTNPDGSKSQIVTWFDDDTGEYSRFKYPLDANGEPNYDMEEDMLAQTVESTQSTQPQATQPVEPSQPVEPTQSVQPTQPTQFVQSTQPVQQKSDTAKCQTECKPCRARKIIAIAVVAVLLLGGGITGAYFLLRKDGGTPTSGGKNSPYANVSEEQILNLMYHYENYEGEQTGKMELTKEQIENGLDSVKEQGTQSYGGFEMSDYAHVHSIVHSDTGLIAKGYYGQQSANGEYLGEPNYFEVELNNDETGYVTHDTMNMYVEHISSSYFGRDESGTGLVYYSVNAIDGDFDTAWITNTEDDDEYRLTITLREEKEIAAIYVANGYQKSKTTYDKNKVVNELEISVNNEVKSTMTMERKNYDSDAIDMRLYGDFHKLEPGIKGHIIDFKVNSATGGTTNHIPITEIYIVTL